MLGFHLGEGLLPVFKAVFAALLLAAGCLLARRNTPAILLAGYAIIIVAFTPRFASQYLAIAVIGLVILNRSVLAWTAHVLGGIAIAISKENIAGVFVDPFRPIKDVFWGYLISHARLWFAILAVVITVIAMRRLLAETWRRNSDHPGDGCGAIWGHGCAKILCKPYGRWAWLCWRFRPGKKPGQALLNETFSIDGMVALPQSITAGGGGLR